MKTMVIVWSMLAVAACSAAPAAREESGAQASPASTSEDGGTGGAEATDGAGVVHSLPRAAVLQADGERCTTDALCASGSCDLRVGVCRASAGAPCHEPVGCAGDQVCAPDCPLASCGGPSCQNVERGVVCRGDHDCDRGAICGADHLCRWPRGGRCEVDRGWCVGEEVCCRRAPFDRCVSRDDCLPF